MIKRTERQNKYYFKCIVLLLGNELGYHKFEMHDSPIKEYLYAGLSDRKGSISFKF